MIEPDWPAPPGVAAVATDRHGGTSEGPYASLNLGAHVGDDPACVAANRAALTAALDLPSEPAWLDQVHGARVIDLDDEPPGTADAAVTSTAGRVLAVLTADCLPVLLASDDGARVGVAHAGWRGLAAGVLPAAVSSMGFAPARLRAWLGPAIGPANYEVGAEVYEALATGNAAAKRCFVPGRPGHWQADLYGLARLALAVAGVEAVFGGDFCTFADTARFFSHRRAAPCGRTATLIWRTP